MLGSVQYRRVMQIYMQVYQTKAKFLHVLHEGSILSSITCEYECNKPNTLIILAVTVSLNVTDQSREINHTGVVS